MFPVTLIVVVLLIVAIIYFASNRKQFRAPGLHKALYLIGAIIVFIFIWMATRR
jgi:K+ transporter